MSANTPGIASRFPTIAALAVSAVVLVSAPTARASTTVVNDATSCQAIGGDYSPGSCRFYGNAQFVVASGNVVQFDIGLAAGFVTVNGEVDVQGVNFWTFSDAVNNGTIKVAAGGNLANMQGTFTNNGTILVDCGATTSGTISGNPPIQGACVPPDKNADKCGGTLVKAGGALAVGITKCQAKLAHSAFKGVPFDENACEAAAKAKFDKAVGKLTKTCPPCALANASTLRDRAQSFFDGSDNLAFCAGSTPLP